MGRTDLVGAISDDKPVDGAPHGGILHHLRQQGLLPRRRGPLLCRSHAQGRLGAHRGARHRAPPERGRRERGRGWGGDAAAGAEEAEPDLVVVRDAGEGHGVGRGNRLEGARDLCRRAPAPASCLARGTEGWRRESIPVPPMWRGGGEGQSWESPVRRPGASSRVACFVVTASWRTLMLMLFRIQFFSFHCESVRY